MRLNWRIKLLVLLILAIPAFSGLPLKMFDQIVLAGITRGWLGYSFVTHSILALVLGPALWAICLSISVAIMLPVVFGGATISYLLYLFGIGGAIGPFGYSAHYLSLSLTMLTVIPLANGLIAVLPLNRIENRLLTREDGVRFYEKAALMFIRVFTHIVFFVIPNVLEIMREERRQQYPGDATLPIRRRIAAAVRTLIYFGVGGICASVQYIPLWADEIAALPDRAPSKNTLKN